MKKLLIVLLLLAVSANAADYCNSFGEYRNAIKRANNIPVTVTTAPFTDTTLNNFVRDAVIYLVPVLRARQASYTIEASYAVGTYSLDSELVGIYAVSWSYNDSLKPLVYMPKEQWYQTGLGHLDGKEAYEHRPAYYDYSDTKLWVFPVPVRFGGVDTVCVDGWSKVINISAADSLSTIRQEYRPTIAAYAAWKVALSIGSPRAQALYDDYIAKFNAIVSRREIATPDK